MASTLDSLTNEIFERIVQCVDLDDIRNLRLVSRTAAYKSTQNTFRRAFRTKHVDMTRSDLEDFLLMTSRAQRLGCSVDHLTLIGVVYNPASLENMILSGRKYQRNEEWPHDNIQVTCSNEELAVANSEADILRQSQDDYDMFHQQSTSVALLNEAFSNIAAYGSKTGLKSLSVEVIVYRESTTTRLSPLEGKCWKRIFRTAAATFALMMESLRDSKLPIHALHAFSAMPWSLGCNIPSHVLSTVDWNAASIGMSLASLRKISLSLSDRIVDETEYDAQNDGDPCRRIDFDLTNCRFDAAAIRAQLVDETNFSGLPALLELCADNLEELTITGYSLALYDQDMMALRASLRKRYVHDLATLDKPFRQLRRLCLSGLCVQDTDLAGFIQRHLATLRDIELREIDVTAGSLTSIVSTLSSSNTDSPLEKVKLEDLREAGRLILFSGDQTQEYTRISGVYRGRNVIERWGPDANKLITYSRLGGRTLDTPSIRAWRMRRRQEFGRG